MITKISRDVEPPKPLDASQESAVLTFSANHHTVRTDRALEYPEIGEYVDAQVKKLSGDPALVAEGIAQEAQYVKACLAIKTKHPRGIS